MDVAALLFDVDDVLFDDTIWHRWLHQLLSRLGLHTHYRAFFRVWQRDYLGQVYCGKRDYWGALRQFLLSSGLTAGQVDEVVVSAQARRKMFHQNIRPFPGVLATVAKLNASGMALSALANSTFTNNELSRFLKRIGLADCFRCVLSSNEIGVTMPDPKSYQVVLDALNLLANRVAFVGHDSEELAGAHAIGMPTIGFNCDDDALADIRLDRFDQLLNVVDSRSRRLLAG